MQALKRGLTSGLTRHTAKTWGCPNTSRVLLSQQLLSTTPTPAKGKRGRRVRERAEEKESEKTINKLKEDLSEDFRFDFLEGVDLESERMSVDVSGLRGDIGEPEKVVVEDAELISRKTPLLEHIKERIMMRGPMTMSEYMTMCLQHPDFGYYTKKKEVFGREGDFVTSPELLSCFGEIIGVWCIAMWEQMGRPEAVRIVEVGPGRGTLMLDLLTTAAQFKDFARALEKGSLEMVEVSPNLKQEQAAKLRTVALEKKHGVPVSGRVPLPDAPNGGLTNIQWHSSFHSVMKKAAKENEFPMPVIVLCQELFDALPVHLFQKRETGWCEKLVDLNHVVTRDELGPDEDAQPASHFDLDGLAHHLRFVVSPKPTFASKLIMGTNNSEAEVEGELNDEIEVSAAAAALTQDIALTIAHFGGAGLVIDYGQDAPQSSSVRGISNHKFVHPLREPGEVDLSADVDFSAIRKVVAKAAQEPHLYKERLGGKKSTQHTPTFTNKITCSKTIGQGEFLLQMHFATRVQNLLDQISDEAEYEALYSKAERLVSTEEGMMGDVFKAISFAALPPSAENVQKSIDLIGFNT